MRSPYAYASKKDLLEWVSTLLQMDLTSLDDVRSAELCEQNRHGIKHTRHVCT
jgi:hypothetical protein